MSSLLPRRLLQTTNVLIILVERLLLLLTPGMRNRLNAPHCFVKQQQDLLCVDDVGRPARVPEPANKSCGMHVCALHDWQFRCARCRAVCKAPVSEGYPGWVYDRRMGHSSCRSSCNVINSPVSRQPLQVAQAAEAIR